jgi:hypothetical protein
MGYSSTGRKPFERASKSSHHHIVNDPEVKTTLESLDFPLRSEDLSVNGKTVPFVPNKNSNISNIVAVDCGYTEVEVRKGFPSSLIHFFQFGALLFSRKDLQALDQAPHIAPEDMAKLNNIERLKLPLPTKGVRRKGTSSLQQTVRLTIHNFLSKETLGEENSLLDTLRWFVFRHYKQKERTAADGIWELSSNPLLNSSGSIQLHEDQIHQNDTFTCPVTGGILYLIDIFRLHEIIDEETGATGICGYLAGVVEHLIAIHIIRHLLISQPKILSETLFIMDRPTGFFGQTARLHVLMEELVNWLFDHHQIYWAGIEKNGAVVDHANEIRSLMPNGSILVLDNNHIYRYISPGEALQNRPYADTSYYGHKVIFKTPKGQMHVVSVPVPELMKEPKLVDLPNLQTILTHIDELHCDMYDSALIPIALVNKLVSLSAHPSSEILKKFAQASVGNQQ